MGSGLFLGGVADGAKTADDMQFRRDQLSQELGLRTRGLDLQEKQQGQELGLRTRALDLQQASQANAQNRQLLTDADKQVSDTMAVIGETIKSGLESNTDPIVIRKAVTPLLDSAKRIASGAGRDPTLLENQVDSQLVRPSGSQTATATGTNAAAAKAAEAKALEAAGVKDANAGFKDKNQVVQAENSLRDDFNKASGEFVKIRDAKNRLDNISETGAGDIALLFQFMKILDPGSTVREGEFATAGSVAGVPGQIEAMRKQIVGGGRLADDARKQILEQSTRLYQAAAKQHDSLQTQYASIAKRNGLNPDNVIINQLPAGAERAPAVAPPAPPAGFTVVQ